MVARVYEVTAVAVDFTFSDDDQVPILKISAKGRVNSGGWSSPELGVWSYIQPPGDGILDLDFLATPPPDGTIVTMGFRNVHAGLLLPVPDWVKGVRVHASTNQMEAMLVAALPPVPAPIQPTGEGCRCLGPSPGTRRAPLRQLVQ